LIAHAERAFDRAGWVPVWADGQSSSKNRATSGEAAPARKWEAKSSKSSVADWLRMF
jgi:hypothetical protein